MSDIVHSPLDWSLAVEAIPEAGSAVRVEATAAERAALVAALGLVALDALRLDGRIDRRAGGRYRLTGKLKADLAQACVVTLDPVAARIDEAVDVEFRPDLTDDADADRVASLTDDAPDVEPIVRGRLATGRIAFETLSAALDPFPRAPDAAFEAATAAPRGATIEPENPFAVLARLKPKTAE